MKRSFAITALIVLSVAAAGSVSAQMATGGKFKITTGKVVSVAGGLLSLKTVTLEGGKTVKVQDSENVVQVGKTCFFVGDGAVVKIGKCE